MDTVSMKRWDVPRGSESRLCPRLAMVLGGVGGGSEATLRHHCRGTCALPGTEYEMGKPWSGGPCLNCGPRPKLLCLVASDAIAPQPLAPEARLAEGQEGWWAGRPGSGVRLSWSPCTDSLARGLTNCKGCRKCSLAVRPRGKGNQL